jgi:hypothetical protein
MKLENPLSCCVQVLCVEVDSSSLASDTVKAKYEQAGYRSLCLVHDKHALYHLSYIPRLCCKQSTTVLAYSLPVHCLFTTFALSNRDETRESAELLCSSVVC